MVTYEVTTTVDASRAEVYERYMCEEHIPALLDTGCFVGASFGRSAPGRYRTSYHAASDDELQRYLAEHAARLRAEFAARFPDVVVASREVWVTLRRWETGAPGQE